MTTYERIDALRKERGIMWSHLNEQIGAYRGKLTEFKNGKTTLSKSEIAKIASILKTSTDYLLGNTDDPSPAGQKEKLPAHGGEPIGPNKRALLNLVENMSEDEMAALLEVVKATLKMRNKK